MSEYLRFWGHCLRHGFEWGNGTTLLVVGIFEFLGFAVTVSVWVWKWWRGRYGYLHLTSVEGLWNRWWHPLENKIGTVSVGLGFFVFLISAIFLMPVHTYEEAHNAATTATSLFLEASNELRSTKIDLAKTQKDLAESLRARVTAVENRKDDVARIKAMFDEAGKEANKVWLDAYSSNNGTASPIETARLKMLASQSYTAPVMTNDGLISIASLRREQAEMDATQKAA